MGRFTRTSAVPAKVPTSSMADIAFLLLIFFMVTTIFKLEEGLPVKLPKAEHGVRVPRNEVAHIWVLSADRITIDDNYVPMVDIPPILLAKQQDNPTLVVGLNADQSVPWEIAAEVIEMMKEGQALNASFTNDPEKGS